MCKILALVLLLFLGSGLWGGEAPRRLRVGVYSLPGSLNPVYSTSESAQALANKVFLALFRFDHRGRVQNELAESVTMEYPASGQMVVTIQLRKDVFFSDGKRLDAGDVVATVKVLMDGDFGYPYRANLQVIKGVRKVAPFGVRLVLWKPFAPWKQYLMFKVLNARELASATPDNFRARILSGSGPYRIKEVRRPDRIILEQNPFNRSNPVYADRVQRMPQLIEYVLLSYGQLGPLKLVAGEIDVCGLQPEAVAAYGDTPSWRDRFDVLKYRNFGCTYLVFNVRDGGNGPKVDANLRRMFYNVLVGGDFTRRFLRGRGEPLRTPFLLLNPDVRAVSLPVRPLKRRVGLTVLTNSESKLRKELVMFLRMEMRALNIDLKPVFLEYHSFLRALKEGRFDMAISGFNLNIDYDMLDVFGKGRGFNYAGLDAPGMQVLLERGIGETDPVKRRALYMDAHRLWLDELPLLPLFSLYSYVGVGADVRPPGELYRVVAAEGDFFYDIHLWSREF